MMNNYDKKEKEKKEIKRINNKNKNINKEKGIKARR